MYSFNMRCPYCHHSRDRVVDSREGRGGEVIRRRRECRHCHRRFTSYERIDAIPYMVVKKSGQRERFDRNKVLMGLLKACEKRPVSTRQLESIVDEVEQRLAENPDREISSQTIGRLVMNRLKLLDKVAYVRFASVYLEFDDVRQFQKQVEEL